MNDFKMRSSSNEHAGHSPFQSDRVSSLPLTEQRLTAFTVLALQHPSIQLVLFFFKTEMLNFTRTDCLHLTFKLWIPKA